jgi:hypothetical protein
MNVCLNERKKEYKNKKEKLAYLYVKSIFILGSISFLLLNKNHSFVKMRETKGGYQSDKIL